ncbi:gliding motility lipoprotein GldB [uncultured Polaribacter sp.]|uniref:gliding motility lipoprotein GldB n=1 Tax=uncultured Polaribacter sp. TaxID=174711 RepID=UPI002621AD74|nr:gliding motility lipoprotein GldB [uncultured Polaribacter sp.]
MKFFIGFLLVLCCFYSCSKQNNQNIDVSKVDVNFKVNRFDIDFYTTEAKDLQQLKNKYAVFFPKEITDSIAIAKINSKDEQELFAETQKVYKDFEPIKKQLTSLFKHVKYYNPKFKSPKVVTMLTNIDYESRVVYADSLLILSLDVFLGKNHPFYNDYPNYIKENNTKEHLIVDVANTIIAQQVLPKPNDRTFLQKMIAEGVKLYVLDAYLPTVANHLKFGANPDKYNWLLANEEQIWSYFIEKELLFSTDTKLNSRFLETAPFSKFYSEQDKLSPGKVGVWVGWQIVRSYMKHNNVSLQELLKMNTTDLYSKSKYKPRK